MDIIHLDIKSMMLMCVFIGILISGGLAALLRDRYVCPGMHYWVAGFFLLTLGVFFAVCRAFAPLWVSVFFGNACSLLGGSLMWLGLLVYNKRIKPFHYAILAVPPLTATLLLIMLNYDVPEIRRAETLSFVLNVQSILCIREALRDRAKYESGKFMFAFTCALATLGSFFRILALQYASPYSLLNTNISNLLMIFNIIILFLGLSFSIMLITSQWLQQKLSAFAAYDALTGIYNRHGLIESSTELFSAANPVPTYSVAMLDIDHFKSINDKYGHPIGDSVLKLVAEKLKMNIRHHDILARYGGEEFIVVLPDTSLYDACLWAERTRKTIAATPFLINQESINVTISIGVASRALTENMLDILIGHADSALYHAKKTGRNKVIMDADVPGENTLGQVSSPV